MSRATVRAMKRDTAERLAATQVEGLTVDDARKVIAVFLRELARCPVCDGSGSFVFGRDVVVETTEDDGRRGRAEQYVAAGTAGSCPCCGSRDPEASGKGDPEWVAWHCVQGERDETCRRDSKEHEERRNGHAACGWRVLLPADTPES
jgi:hypothetical protein